MAEQFFVYDEFIATDVSCPGCNTTYHLDVKTGETDSRYLCSDCNRTFSVDWEERTVQLID